MKKDLDTYAVFWILKRFFTTVEKKRKMFKILRRIGIKFTKKRIIWNQHKNQKTKMRLGGKEGNETKSLLIYNEAIEEVNEKEKVG